jgi:hypothetical protein
MFFSSIASGILFFATIGYLSATLPHAPQPEKGQTEEMQWSIARPSFATKANNNMLRMLFWAGSLCLIAAAITEMVTRRIKAILENRPFNFLQMFRGHHNE